MNLPERDPFPRCSVQSPRRLSLRLRSKVDVRTREIIREVTDGLPELSGGPICVWAKPHLKAYRGYLLSGINELGMPVHAASYIRRRAIILETQLLARPEKLRMIVAHEVFHFVWARLGNQRRAEYSAIVFTELAAGARGELGESADGWKLGVPLGGDLKNYICESFCDTGAWLYSGARSGRELTLAAKWRRVRRSWFCALFGSGMSRC